MQEKIIKYRLVIVLAALGVTLLSFLTFPRLKVNANLEDYVPDTIKNKVYQAQLDSIFGGSEVILVLLETDDVVNEATLARLELIAQDACQIEGINHCVSPFDVKRISYEDDITAIDPFFENLSVDTDYGLLKTQILENAMAKRFFSNDFKLVSLVLTKQTHTPDTVIEEIKNTIEKYPGDEKVVLGGLPYIRYSIAGFVQKDMMLLLPVAMLLMIFILYFSFREWKGVFMPFVIVLMAVIMAFAIMALLGWQISLFSILMPIMIIAIANDYGIHLIARYQELAKSRDNLSMKVICKQIFADLKWPILIAGLTTIGGVLGLLTHTMVPAAQLGVLTALGIGFSLVLSIFFLPALLSYFKPSERITKAYSRKKSFLDIQLEKCGAWIVKYPKRILFSIVFITAMGIIGMYFIRVDTNIENYFSGSSGVRQSIEAINDKFGGAQFLSVLFKGEVLEPKVLKRMEAYAETIAADPSVGLVSSPVDLVKELSKGFYAKEDEGYNAIPSTSDEIYQLLEIFSLGGDEEALSQFLDDDYEHARMLVSLSDGDNVAKKRIMKALQELTKDDKNVQFISGAGLTEIELADIVVKGQFKSLVLALAIIFILVSLMFRSLNAGWLSSLPLAIAIVLLFGLMGFFGVAIDIATALLSSIMIGVGVDYTIHFLWRFKEERSHGKNADEAISESMMTTGRSIVINAFSVIIGFLPLLLSNFLPLKFFGALIVISITTCLACSLILVPCIVLLVRPKFLDP